MGELIKQAGAFGMLSIAGGGVGVMLALLTVVLAMAKSNVAKVLSVLCVLCALAVLGPGEIGHATARTAAERAMGNVPDDQKDLVMFMGARDARASLMLALGASLLPLLAAVLASAVLRFRVGLAMCVVAAGAWAVVLVQSLQPLPSKDPVLYVPEGLQLAHSMARRPLAMPVFVALGVDGLHVDRAKVELGQLKKAVDRDEIRGRNSSTLPLVVDERVPFSSLAGALQALESADRHSLQLVVLSKEEENRVIAVGTVRGSGPGPGDKPLRLTVVTRATGFEIGASGGTLPLIALTSSAAPCDAAVPPARCYRWDELNAKLGEIKTAFPDNERVRVSAEPNVPFELVIKTLDAVRERDNKLMNGELILGGPLTP